MKYKLQDKSKSICFPRIYDDDISWFREQKDPLTPEERELVENIYTKIMVESDIDKIYNLLNELSSVLKKTTKTSTVTKNVINGAVSLLQKELKLISFKDTPSQIIKNNKIFNKFLERGVVQMNINKKLYSELQTKLNDKVNHLINLPKPNMKVYTRGYLMERTLLLNKEELQILNKILIDLNIYNYCKQYYKTSFSLYSARLHRSTNEDEHNLQTLNDLIKDNPPSHKNLHIDPKLDMKCIIYLNNVKAENGPFSYIHGSHLYAKDNIVVKNMAKAINVYNINNTPEKRFEFLCLPKGFQNSANFGNYILEDSKNGVFIKNNLKPCLYENGNLIFFDPEGIHLGGNVVTGQRIAIQVVLKPNI